MLENFCEKRKIPKNSCSVSTKERDDAGTQASEHSTAFLPSLPKYNGSQGGATGFSAVCVHTDTASAVGGWGTNYTKILQEFNTGPVLPCKYLFSDYTDQCYWLAIERRWFQHTWASDSRDICEVFRKVKFTTFFEKLLEVMKNIFWRTFVHEIFIKSGYKLTESSYFLINFPT